MHINGDKLLAWLTAGLATWGVAFFTVCYVIAPAVRHIAAVFNSLN